MRKILGARWFTNVTLVRMPASLDADYRIGIVAATTAIHTPESQEWKAYIGLGRGLDEQADEQKIADWGTGLSAEEAHGFFPHLNIAHYKGATDEHERVVPDSGAENG